MRNKLARLKRIETLVSQFKKSVREKKHRATIDLIE